MRMTTYLYCIRSDADELPAGLVGVDGTAVHTIGAAGMTAWVSKVPGPMEPTVDRVRAHDAVCAAAMREGETPLPIRFGQTFNDDSAAEVAIVSRQGTLRERLARVAGCVELRVVVKRGKDAGVHVDSVSGAPEAASAGEGTGPGTAFLQRLARAGRDDLAREIGCEDVRHTIRRVANSFIVDQQPCESARGVAFFPILVRRSDVDALRSAVASLLSSQAIDLAILGPFAPYSFAADA
jgi:gas vesicle protein GvpL/GvpF